MSLFNTSHSPMASPASSSFIPPTRPFPPPALKDVPIPYILNQLHNLALNYWDKPHTADCTILVPIVPQRPSTSARPSPYGFDANAPLAQHASASASARPTRMTSKLHLDYLLAQSSLFRDLFSHKSHGTPQRHSHTPTPRILPSPPHHPIIHLPLPSPSSFPHLVHFMYFGTFEVLERALDNDELRWEDVVRNVEYLGMRGSVRRFLEGWRAVSMGLPIPVSVSGSGSLTSHQRMKFGVCGGSEVDEDETDEECADDECDDDEGQEDVFSESGSSEMSFSTSNSNSNHNHNHNHDDMEEDDDEDEDESDRSETDGSLETLADDEPLVVPTKYFKRMQINVGVDVEERERGRSRTRISPTAASHSPLRRR